MFSLWEVRAFNVIATWGLIARLIRNARALSIDCVGREWVFEPRCANDNERIRSVP